jgi:alpha-L-fucosidase
LVYDNVTAFACEYALDGPKTFNVAMVKENLLWGQRIEFFALDAWDGKDWNEIAEGTTVGWKKLLRFPAIETAKVRLRIFKARAAPSLPDLGLFLDPGKESDRRQTETQPPKK